MLQSDINVVHYLYIANANAFAWLLNMYIFLKISSVSFSIDNLLRLK